MPDDSLIARISALEAELRSLQAAVASKDRPARVVDDPYGRRPVTEYADRAERLFDVLLATKRVVGYGQAYELLFGEKPVQFQNAVHVPRLLDLATRTTIRHHKGLEIRLDALIVALRGRLPGPGHFRAAPYSQDQWLDAFGNWPFLR
jgi:hypothetical protein